MKVIFFSKCSKFYVDFENATTVWENVEGSEDNCVWTCYWIFCQLLEEFMWSAVNLVKSGPKISDPTKRHDEELNSFNINWTLA